MQNQLYSCFATTNRGLETPLEQELVSYGAINTQTTNAGIKFEASFVTIMKCNLYSRIASRIMIQIGFAEYHSENDIYNLAINIKWQDWFTLKHTIKVATTAIHSPLKSLEFVTLKVKDAICDNFSKLYNARPDVDKHNPDMRIYNFLTNDTVTIYLDTSGEGLFKRGYRKSKLEAPLKENLAAGLLSLANWHPNIPLYDPMCGSGTIPMEAISIGLNIPSGFSRSFAFEKFVCMNEFQHQWTEIKHKAKLAINYNQNLNIYASDINKQALSSTIDNFNYMNLLDYVTFSHGDFLELPKPSILNKLEANESNLGIMHNTENSSIEGMILTNPPYGVRLDELNTLAEFYPKLAHHLKQNFANWSCYFITADLRLPKLMRLKPSRKIPVFNGDLECRLFEFKMVQGSNRK